MVDSCFPGFASASILEMATNHRSPTSRRWWTNTAWAVTNTRWERSILVGGVSKACNEVNARVVPVSFTIHRLHGFYRGRKTVVPLSQYIPEQDSDLFEPDIPTNPSQSPVQAGLPQNVKTCYLDEEETLEVPVWSAYNGLPRAMSAPLFGSHQELGFNLGQCYDRISRLGPYGMGSPPHDGDDLYVPGGDNQVENLPETIDWSKVNWAKAQKRCSKKNGRHSKTAVVIRTWHGFQYKSWHIAMLRAMISELALASGGEYEVHFLIHVQDDTIPIWASDAIFNRVLKESLPEEFQGMGTLWSVAQMKLIYPPPFPESIINFSGGDIYQAYRSLHFPLQYFASRNPEYDYFWQWEMDLRVTGHYYELLHQVTNWAERQPKEYAWEKSSKFFIPALFDNSYQFYSQSIKTELEISNQTPISGPQVPKEKLLPLPGQQHPSNSDHITDLITLSPLFNPNHTCWAFQGDITGYNNTRPPTRAALITASRMSRRLLLLMHEETYQEKHTMFPEMYPASIALHYGLKAIYAPIPIYFDRDWPAIHADEVFNNAKLSEKSKSEGMTGLNGYYHGIGGSVFGPSEHVFRGGSYYSNAAFASYLWRRWLGHENRNDEIEWELENGVGGGRMCLPMMVVHPIKED